MSALTLYTEDKIAVAKTLEILASKTRQLEASCSRISKQRDAMRAELQRLKNIVPPVDCESIDRVLKGKL